MHREVGRAKDLSSPLYKNKRKQIMLDWYEITEPHTVPYPNP